ncbi:YetF domain-containing protein [Pseudomonas saudiphocaensis]|uniref:YetF domain-containing protein n=1 Tax=Pseudomonas saudiphocaensis TaxID=1499686 RepID=UPI00187D451B|nr:YetF domain-containing protein [Pseudomonas saudiphocaensis]MBE7927777.1 DUF421 domain-containing protein [Pseudomonas saudiphocaensis]
MSPFDWQRIWLDELPLLFVAEVVLRAFFAYVAVFLFLKISGRRGIRQLSLFELVVILTLGSAAGDVSFNEDEPLLPILTVFVTLLLLYRLTMWAMAQNPRLANWMEGKPITIIKNGLYELNSLDRLNISSDEFFMELRQQGVEHLGQVRLGIVETDGDVSLYYAEPDEVRPGLSVLPPEHNPIFRRVPSGAIYACSRCGFTQRLENEQEATCPRCQNAQWSLALNTQRTH